MGGPRAPSSAAEGTAQHAGSSLQNPDSRGTFYRSSSNGCLPPESSSVRAPRGEMASPLAGVGALAPPH